MNSVHGHFSRFEVKSYPLLTAPDQSEGARHFGPDACAVRTGPNSRQTDQKNNLPIHLLRLRIRGFHTQSATRGEPGGLGPQQLHGPLPEPGPVSQDLHPTSLPPHPFPPKCSSLRFQFDGNLFCCKLLVSNFLSEKSSKSCLMMTDEYCGEHFKGVAT